MLLSACGKTSSKTVTCGTTDNPCVITFVPSGDTGKITTAGQEIADWLSAETGLSFKIEVGTSFAASIEAMGANKAQIGFLNTFSVLLAESKYGIEPALAVVRKLAVISLVPIANEFAEAVSKLHSSSLIEIGLVLFFLTLLLNSLAQLLVWNVARKTRMEVRA